MKNSREHAQQLQKCYRSLKRAYPKVEPMTYDDPVDALIYAIVSERMDESAAATAMKGIKETFINLNDLRVSRVEEIVEVFGADTPAGRSTAFLLTTVLRAVFDVYHTVSLQALKKMGKRPARQALEKLQGISRFAVNYCVLTSLQAHAVPLTERMTAYLKRDGIVDPHADEEDIEGFLTRQVPARSSYEFYALLRRESESSKRGRRKTPTRKGKSVKNVAKAKK